MRREDTVVAPMPSAPSSSWEAETNVQPTTPRTRGSVDPSARVLPLRPVGPAPVAAPTFMQQPSAPPPPPRPARGTPRRPLTTPPAPATTGERSLTQALQALELDDADLEREASIAEAPAARARGQIVVVFGCRGGAGATTLAVNTGAALARAGKSVCLIDLDLQLGDVFVALDLEPTTSLAALAREAGTIDGPALRRRLVRHDSGLYALGQTGRLDDVDAQLAERMPALLAALTDHFDVVLVDGVRDFGDHALAALDMADRVMLVVTQDVPAVRRATRALALFRQLGYSERKVQLVVNHASGKAAVNEAELERALGLPIGARVRNDWLRLSSALDQGALLSDVARGTAVARDVEALAAAVVPDAARASEPKAERPGLLARLFHREAR